MRLFVAVDLDVAMQRAIAGIADMLRSEFDKAEQGLARAVKWVDPRRMHLTLQFVGEVDETVAGALRAAFSSHLALAPFEVECGDLGVFPPSGPARVVWLSASRGARELSALHALVRERVAGLPVGQDDRPFQPHLTLGRFRQPPRRDIRGILQAVASTHTGASLVSCATLYRSHLSSSGPTYEVVARAPLTR